MHNFTPEDLARQYLILGAVAKTLSVVVSHRVFSENAIFLLIPDLRQMMPPIETPLRRGTRWASDRRNHWRPVRATHATDDASQL